MPVRLPSITVVSQSKILTVVAGACGRNKGTEYQPAALISILHMLSCDVCTLGIATPANGYSGERNGLQACR